MNSILDQFRQGILPKIRWFYVESSSIKRTVRCTNCPNLYGLGLYDLEVKRLKSFSFPINITESKGKNIVKNISKIFVSDIFLKFEQLQYLNCGPSPGCSPWAFGP